VEHIHRFSQDWPSLRHLMYHCDVRTYFTLAFALATAALPACSGDDGGTPPDPPVVDADLSCGGTVPYLASCTTNETCATCLCGNFGHIQICTQTCTVAADCPAPATVCSNNMCR
jgi:hypothetical protein